MTSTVATVIAAVVISAIICFPVIATWCTNRWNTRELSADDAAEGVVEARKRAVRKRNEREWKSINRSIREVVRQGHSYISAAPYSENVERLRKLGYKVTPDTISWDKEEVDQ